MKDKFERELSYLRVSVVDRCNLRCLYCMPTLGAGFAPWNEILSDDEIVTLVRLFTELGISKVRLTGGEPLARPGIASLVSRLRKNPDIKELALSTNGVLLKEQARDLRNAGLDRINISLDTLKRDRFLKIARMDRLDVVLEGIDAALGMGFHPVKINTVLMRSVNEDEILDLVQFAIDHAIEIRFIEYMPTNNHVPLEWKAGFFSAEEAQAVIEKEYILISKDTYLSSPARVCSIKGTQARVGFISPLSCIFCSRCNRLRLKANGALKTCLHGQEDLNLKALLRAGISETEIKQKIEKVVFDRPEQHFLNDSNVRHQDFQMSHIGG